jgi:hypothetical protein
MTKHTPGPWEALFNGHYWEFVNSESFQIGDVCASQYDGDRHTKENPNYDLAKANAHLIAAAPELLHALQMARSYIIASGAKHWEKDLAKVDAAIAKAEAS